MELEVDMVVIIIERDSGEPVYGQIARQIRDEIASGGLKPGFMLPPVRTLASDLGINLNTVARAYRQLQDDGFIRIRNRSGAEVTPPADVPAPETRERLLDDLRGVLSRLRQAGVPADDLARLVRRELARLETLDGAPA